MSWLDGLLSALGALRSNILRSVLTALGIIIGVAAVIAVVAIGAGAEQRVESVIQGLGSNILIVLNGSSTSGGARGGSGTQISLTEEDALALQNQIASVQYAAPSVRGNGQAVFGNANWFTSLYGVTNDYLEVRNWEISHGRAFTEQEIRSAAKVAIVGETLVEQLFAGQDPMDQIIRIQRVPFRVIGVLKGKGQTPWGSDQDDTVFLPLSTAKKRILGGRRIKGNLVGNITVKAASAEQVSDAEREVTDLLRQRHRIRPGQTDDFSIRNVSSFLEARAESSRVMSTLLASVAGISLLVGGIGIMNIMLVSVTERTREIGLRMAVGAQSRDIMAQFIIEAVALAMIGGLLGIVVGVAGSVAVAQLAEFQMIIAFPAILMAVGFSAVVGVFFGYYPARIASRLDPIEALRHE